MSILSYIHEVYKMNIENIKCTPGRKTKKICVRVSYEVLQWLKTNRYSATKIFNEAVKDLKGPQ